MKWTIYLIVMLATTTTVLAQWSFTEIMYNPLGSDANREWVEITGPALNDSVLFLEGSNTHQVTLIQGHCTEDCVIIIADQAPKFLEEHNVTNDVLVYEAGWSALSNSGERVGLQLHDRVKIEFVYPTIANDGESIHQSFGQWSSMAPSPGIIANSSVPEFSAVAAAGLALLAIGVISKKRR